MELLVILPGKRRLLTLKLVFVFKLTQSYSPLFTTNALIFTAYTSYSASSTDTGCTTRTTEISLSTPYSFDKNSGSLNLFVAESSFLSQLSVASCYTSEDPALQDLSATRMQDISITRIVLIPPSLLPEAETITITSTSQPIATIATSLPSQTTAAFSNLSSSQHPQNSSGNTGETDKLIIGLVVAVVIAILLVTIGFAYLCIMRKRRRRQDAIAKAHDDVNKSGDESVNPPLYLQENVELDDEQRRHEMEAVEPRHEMQGADKIYEMSAGEEIHGDRKELEG